DRPGDPQDAVEAARAERSPLQRIVGALHRLSRGSETAAQFRSRDLGVGTPWGPGQASERSFPGELDAFGDDLAGLGELQVVPELGPAGRCQLELEIDAVEQRPRQAGRVLAADAGRAGAVDLLGRGAWTRVRR